MTKKQGTPRSQMHDWQPCADDENQVYCQKCGVKVYANVARRGIGPCDGKTVKPYTEPESFELSPEDIRNRIPTLKPFKPSGEDHGTCNGCGQPLKEMPFNSRLAMVACANRRCNLYRNRLRFLSRQ